MAVRQLALHYMYCWLGEPLYIKSYKGKVLGLNLPLMGKRIWEHTFVNHFVSHFPVVCHIAPMKEMREIIMLRHIVIC